jgi:hypothetical protein
MSVKPLNDGFVRRYSQIFLVPGGSKAATFLYIGQNAFDDRACSFNLIRWFTRKHTPLLVQPLHSKFCRDAQQLRESRPHERSPNARGIVGGWI